MLTIVVALAFSMEQADWAWCKACMVRMSA